MGGMSKGGESKTEVKIPPELKQAAIDNLARTEKIGSIGYMPYRGPSVAAMTPRQEASMRNTNMAARAFGMAGGDVGPTEGMPNVLTAPGGARGYNASGPLDAAIASIPKAQRDALAKFFINPNPKRKTAAGGGSSVGGGKHTPAAAFAALNTKKTSPFIFK